MNKQPSFYKDRVCLNILVNSIENAQDCYREAEGNILLGLLSKNYHSDSAAIQDMKQYQEVVGNAISIGLGAGDPNQSDMVTRLSGIIQPQHVNQVFTGVNGTRMVLKQNQTFVNGLVSPTGKVGFVNIATGPLSSKGQPIDVPTELAITMLKDMGASSIKYYPMKGLFHVDEYKDVAEKCGKFQFNLEPTGGLDLDNYEEILNIALEADVPKVIPHVYSSIIDSETGDTRAKDVRELYDITKKLLK